MSSYFSNCAETREFYSVFAAGVLNVPVKISVARARRLTGIVARRGTVSSPVYSGRRRQKPTENREVDSMQQGRSGSKKKCDEMDPERG